MGAAGTGASGADAPGVTLRTVDGPGRRALRVAPARFPARDKAGRGGTLLVFRLGRPGKVRVTVFGPGPSCNRLGTFGRRGRAGRNSVLFSGRLHGRPLPAGRYAIVVDVVRGTNRVRLGRVLIEVLPRHGREGGSRPLATPECGTGPDATSAFGGALVSAAGGEVGRSASRSAAAGVAGASTTRNDNDGLPGLPIVPPLPPLAFSDLNWLSDLLMSPLAVFAFAGLLAAAVGAAAAGVVYGVRRRGASW